MPEDMQHFRKSLEKRRLRVIADLLPRKETERILDAGCGSGWLSEMLSAQGRSIHAVDLGLDSIKRASSRIKRIQNPDYCNNIFFALGDVYRLPYSDGCFDAAVASEIIEHIEKPVAAFHELGRVIRKDGTLIVSTPYREEIEQVLCIHCNKKTPVNAHLHSFDETTLETLLNDAGFTVQRTMLYVNRPAERFGLAGVTSFFPHVIWSMLDTILCTIVGRQSFMAVKARKR